MYSRLGIPVGKSITCTKFVELQDWTSHYSTAVGRWVPPKLSEIGWDGVYVIPACMQTKYARTHVQTSTSK